LKRLFALCMFILIVSGSTFAFGYEGKYQDLFYPNGMPDREGYFGTGPTAYHFYDEAEIPASNLLFILYSEEILTPGISTNNEHTAFLAIVNKTNSDLKVIKTIDVTEYISVEMESAGCFAQMGGILDIFQLKNNTNVLHLSIAGRLSGSGSHLSSSDVFFLVEPANNSLSPVLKLLDTATFARSGVSESTYYYKKIYTLSDEQTGTQILTQDYNYEYDASKNIDQGILNPTIDVYQYDFDNKKYSLKSTISGLPASATLIKRTVNCNTDCTSGCNE
jgi:hypothetical protein